MTRSILVKNSDKQHSTPRSTTQYATNTPSIYPWCSLATIFENENFSGGGYVLAHENHSLSGGGGGG